MEIINQMLITDNEIQLLTDENTDLNEQHINIMRRLAVECNYDASAMLNRVSEIFCNAMRADQEFQEIVDSLMASLRYVNEQIRTEFEDKLIKIGLYQLQMAFEKVIELAPNHTDIEICKIFKSSLESDDFEHDSLHAAKQSDAYADLIISIAKYQLEQYSSPPLMFSKSEELSLLPKETATPGMRR